MNTANILFDTFFGTEWRHSYAQNGAILWLQNDVILKRQSGIILSQNDVALKSGVILNQNAAILKNGAIISRMTSF